MILIYTLSSSLSWIVILSTLKTELWGGNYDEHFFKFLSHINHHLSQTIATTRKKLIYLLVILSVFFSHFLSAFKRALFTVPSGRHTHKKKIIYVETVSPFNVTRLEWLTGWQTGWRRRLRMWCHCSLVKPVRAESTDLRLWMNITTSIVSLISHFPFHF